MESFEPKKLALIRIWQILKTTMESLSSEKQSAETYPF